MHVASSTVSPVSVFDDLCWQRHPTASNRWQAALPDGAQVEVWTGRGADPLKLGYKPAGGCWRLIGHSLTLTGLVELWEGSIRR